MEVKIYKIEIQNTPNEIYIGATTTDLNTRLSQHIWDAKNKSSSKSECFYDAIMFGLNLNIEIIETTNINNYKEREEYFFNYYENKGYKLLNTYLKSGGIVINRSFESIQKSSKAKEIPIEQLDFDNNIIKEWSSAKQVTLETGILNTAIGNVLNGRSPSAGGYFWRYKGNTNLKPKSKTAKSCFLFNKENKKEIEFQSISKAARTINANVDRVIAVLAKNKNFEKEQYIISRYSLNL